MREEDETDGVRMARANRTQMLAKNLSLEEYAALTERAMELVNGKGVRIMSDEAAEAAMAKSLAKFSGAYKRLAAS